MTHEINDDVNDDRTLVGHVGRRWVVARKPKNKSLSEKFTEDPKVKHLVSFSQSKKISEDATALPMAIMARLCNLMQEVEGTVDKLREMKGDVRNRETDNERWVQDQRVGDRMIAFETSLFAKKTPHIVVPARLFCTCWENTHNVADD